MITKRVTDLSQQNNIIANFVIVHNFRCYLQPTYTCNVRNITNVM